MLSNGRHLPFPKALGVTLVELMIALAIMILLMVMAAPSYTQWIANTKVRTTAEAIQNGLMMAKGEALRRNTKVQMVLTTSSPDIANVGAAASTAGTNWIVRVYQAAGAYTSADFVGGRSAAEGSSNTTVSAGQSNFIFTGVGSLSPTPGAAVAINISGSGSNRPLRIEVTQGGGIRMCDPNLASTAMGC
jgi:type IV fimbrial biogenesis protein FimT